MQTEADRLAELGLAVIACNGKVPNATKNGVADGRAGVAPALRPGQNIGIVAGKSRQRLAIFDADDLTHPMVQWVLEQFPYAPRVRTGAGAVHVYFLDPAKKGDHESVKAGATHELYSLRRGNSFVVAPPSVHPDTGQPYTWEVPFVAFEALPEWSAECSERHTLSKLCAVVAGAEVHSRQDTLYHQSIKAWRLQLPQEVVDAQLRMAAAHCGLQGHTDVDRQIERAKAIAQDSAALADDADPTIAKAIIAQLGGDALTASIDGELWRYSTAGHWRREPDAWVLQRVYAAHDRMTVSGPKVEASARKAASVLSAVHTLRYAEALPGSDPVLAFRDLTVYWANDELVACAHDPALGAVVSLPFNWQGEAETPAWDAYIASCVPNEAQRTLLLEHVGVALLGRGSRLGRALFVLGPKGSGKSTCLEFVLTLFPDGMVAHIDPAAMGKQFAAGSLTEHTRLCAVDEFGRSNVLQDDKWKSAVQGHPVQVERKYHDPRMVRPCASWLAIGNTLPSCPGVHDSFFQRWTMVQFPLCFRGTPQEDVDLLAKLKREREPFTRRAIVAGAEALTRGRFTHDAEQFELLALWQNSSDSVAEWRATCTAPDGRTGLRIAHATYRTWCEVAGYKAVAQGEFKRRLLMLGERIAHNNDRNEVWAFGIAAEH